MRRFFAAAAILLVGIMGCYSQERRTSLNQCLLAGREAEPDASESPLRLVACQVPEVRTNDGSAPDVLVLLINNAPSALFADGTIELGANLFVELVDPEGEVLPPYGDTLPLEPMPVELGIFPRHGVLGRFIDLACELPGNIITEDDATCIPYVEVERPGEYAVTFIARIQWCPEHCGLEDAEVVEVRSSPVLLEFR